MAIVNYRHALSNSTTMRTAGAQIMDTTTGSVTEATATEREQ